MGGDFNVFLILYDEIYQYLTICLISIIQMTVFDVIKSCMGRRFVQRAREVSIFNVAV